MPTIDRIDGYADELTAIRRDLHAHPEIGFEEVRTSGIVADKLRNDSLYGAAVAFARKHHAVPAHTRRLPARAARGVFSGIQPEIADRIFEPFVTTKGVGFGMGMGLSITRNVLQGMGGTIEVAYSSPEGTTFGLTLQPYEEESEEAPDSYAEAEAVSGREDARLNVLIIDDEERVLAYLKNALSHHDVSVEIDGRKAVDRASTGDFDVVLCDLMMPRMSGMEIYSELKERSPNVASRMLFMTGGVFAEKVAEFLETLPGRWIEKPINFGELESRIWSMIEAVEGSKTPVSEASTGGGA